TGQRGVRVPINQYAVRPLSQKNRFDLLELLSGHRSMGASSNRQLVVWPGDVHFIKKDIGHGRVVMLSRMDNGFPKPAMACNGPGDCCGFDELGPGAQNGGYGPHATAFLAQLCVSSTWCLSTCS